MDKFASLIFNLLILLVVIIPTKLRDTQNSVLWVIITPFSPNLTLYTQAT